MKDRVPRYPGRVTITPENGTAYTATIARNDNPTQVGTPLITATLLSDTTAANLGLTGDNATPDKAFDALTPKIGDIKETVRTDLGENWLECNGASVNATDYPDLATLLPPSYANWTQVSDAAATALGSSSVKYLGYLNGYYVVHGGSRKIAYTADPVNGTWTVANVPAIPAAMGYFKGEYLLGSREYEGYYHSSTLNGTWSSANIKQGFSYAINALGFYATKEYLYILGLFNSQTQLYYTSSFTNTAVMYSAATVYANVICGANGYIFCCKDNDKIYAITSPNTAGTYIRNLSGYTNSVKYLNGKYYVFTESGVYSSPNLTEYGTWTQVTSERAHAAEEITKDGTILWASGSSLTSLSIAPGGDMDNIKVVENAFPNTVDNSNDLANAPKVSPGAMFCLNSGTNTYYNNGSSITLPNIQLNGAKAYIKAK